MLMPSVPRKSPVAPKPTVKKTVKPSGGNAETKLKKEIAKGNTKKFDKTRESIAKKTGTWPNGFTN